MKPALLKIIVLFFFLARPRRIDYSIIVCSRNCVTKRWGKEATPGSNPLEFDCLFACYLSDLGQLVRNPVPFCSGEKLAAAYSCCRESLPLSPVKAGVVPTHRRMDILKTREEKG